MNWQQLKNDPKKLFGLALVTAIVVLFVLVMIVNALKGGNEPQVAPAPVPTMSQPAGTVESSSAAPNPIATNPEIDAVGPGETSDDRTQFNREDVADKVLTEWRSKLTAAAAMRSVERNRANVTTELVNALDTDPRQSVYFPDGLVDRNVDTTRLLSVASDQIFISYSIVDEYANGNLMPYTEQWLVTLDLSGPNPVIKSWVPNL